MPAAGEAKGRVPGAATGTPRRATAPRIKAASWMGGRNLHVLLPFDPFSPL